MRSTSVGAVGWNALCGCLVIMALTGCGSREEGPGRDVEQGGAGEERKTALAALEDGFYSVTVVSDGRGSCRLHSVSRHPPASLVICDPDAPAAVLVLRLGIVELCLKEEDGIDLDALVLQAVEAASQAVSEDLRERCSTGEWEPVKRRANEIFRRELETNGWLESLRQGWRKYSTEESSCYRRQRELFEKQGEMFAQKFGIRCDSWELGLGLCTDESEEVKDHIKLFTGSGAGEEKERVIRVLMQKAGLVNCLAAIIEQDDPSLAAEVSRLRAGLWRPGGPDSDSLSRRAWSLWRRRGVEQWLEEVADTGELSEELRLKIAFCGGGRLPPVVVQ